MITAIGGIVARAPLPTRHGLFQLWVFRYELEPELDQVALIHGDVRADDVLVRVHSECLTGEVFGSLKCDCAAQLDDAQARIAAEGRGLVIYLRQEGRGIGLSNKLRAYALQSRGLDTVDANLALGLPVDARRYDAAAWLLGELGVKSVRLLTNSPHKAAALEALGVKLRGSVRTVIAPTTENASYLESKRVRLGHSLPAQSRR